MTALLLVAHGTRDPAGAAVTEAVAEQVRGLTGARVEACYADVRHPTPAEALAGLPGPVVAVPMFLAAGYHVRVDVPAQLAATGRADVRLAETFGPDPALVAAAASRLRTAGMREGDAVVLAVVGSSDPHAQADGATAARRLARELRAPVTPGHDRDGRAAGAGGGRRLRAGGARRVAVASWLLAPGLFQRALVASGADVVADPLATHDAVAGLVVARSRRAALGGPRRVAAWHGEPAPARGRHRPWRVGARYGPAGPRAGSAARRQDHALGAQAGQLLGGDVRGARAVGAQHAVPGQVVAVLGEDPADEPGAAGDARRRRDLAVRRRLARRDRPHRRTHAPPASPRPSAEERPDRGRRLDRLLQVDHVRGVHLLDDEPVAQLGPHALDPGRVDVVDLRRGQEQGRQVRRAG